MLPRSPSIHRTAFLAVFIGALVLGPASARAASCADTQWVTSWAAPPTKASDQAFFQQTLRMVVSPHLAGSQVRVRLTNRFGSAPITFAEVHVGQRQSGAALVPGTNHTVTFGGSGQVTIPAGSDALSDPVDFAVQPFHDVAVSLRIDSWSGKSTTHDAANQLSYYTAMSSAARGGEDSGDAYSNATSSWYYLGGLDVLHAGGAAIAAMGDSITDIGKTTFGENRRWPDDLQRRILDAPSLDGVSIVNEGLVGNQLGRDDAQFGQAAIHRIGPDVFAAVAGLKAVMVLEGTNDIAGQTPPPASADEIIGDYKQLIADVHAHGATAIGMTLPDTAPSVGTPSLAAVRRAVNDWIRTSGAFDAVVDTQKALEDPAHPGQLNPALSDSDGVHPNDAGTQAIADAVSLGTLEQLICGASPPPAPQQQQPAQQQATQQQATQQQQSAHVQASGVKTPAPRLGNLALSAKRVAAGVRVSVAGKAVHMTCRGTVSVILKAGSVALAHRTTRVAKDCSFKYSVVLRNKRKLRRVRRVSIRLALKGTTAKAVTHSLPISRR